MTATGARTHYQVLRLPITAQEQEIKAAYRRAARVSHPDRGGDPEEFRRVTEAYQTLIDPVRRATYDRSYNASLHSASANAGNEQSTAGARFHAGPGQADTERKNAERSREVQDGGLPLFVPPFGSDEPPPLSLDLASRQIHGVPRKRRRSLFNSQARLVREARVIELIQRQILSRYPSARLINGLSSRARGADIDHVVLMGYRMAVVGSMMLPEGSYRWDGTALSHGNRRVIPPQLLSAVHALGRLFPECTVSGWVIVISPGVNPYQPVLDYSPGHAPDGSGLCLVGAARLGRQLGSFLAGGSTPEVVDLHLLSRLLGDMS